MPDTTRRDFLFSAFAFLAPGEPFGLEWQRKAGGHRGPVRYLHIHGNETTAREVLLDALPALPGLAVFVPGSERLVSIGGARIDPNRMWSREGAGKSLRRYNPNLTGAARILDILDADRARLLDELLPPSGGFLVALHNNGPGYSMAVEAPISDRVHQPQPDQPRNFFLFTNERDFDLAREGPYNAVLQSSSKGEEDGSLSRLCTARGVRYVNLECALGAGEEQRERLQWLMQTMPRTRIPGYTAHAHGIWTLEDGVITGLSDYSRPGPGYLLTGVEYTDFVLDLDFWVSKGGNSGVFIRQPLRKFSIRGDERAAQRPTDGHEIQIDYNDPKNYTGSVYNFQKPAKVVGGEDRWNHFTIECVGPRVTVKVDGELVNDYDKVRSPKGAIGFQMHGQKPHDDIVRFRNVVIRQTVADRRQ
jgi:hypothetical protein